MPVFCILSDFKWLHDIQSNFRPRDENKLSECSCYKTTQVEVYTQASIVYEYEAVKIVRIVICIITVSYLQSVKALMSFILM
jgi:hypothetical protein